jgi:hypothetical protein
MVWKKGESGNPGGRPRSGLSIRSCIRAKAGELIEIEDADGTKRMVSRGEAIAHKLYLRAAEGDMWAIRLCLDNVDGPPVQQIDHSGSGLSIRIGGVQDPPEEIPQDGG